MNFAFAYIFNIISSKEYCNGVGIFKFSTIFNICHTTVKEVLVLLL